jgi:hypothetical protein
MEIRLAGFELFHVDRHAHKLSEANVTSLQFSAEGIPRFMGQVFAKTRHDHAHRGRGVDDSALVSFRRWKRRERKPQKTLRTRWKCFLFVSCKHQEEEKI